MDEQGELKIGNPAARGVPGACGRGGIVNMIKGCLRLALVIVALALQAAGIVGMLGGAALFALGEKLDEVAG